MTLWRAARSEADRRESLASFRTGASEAGWTIPHAVGSAPFVVPPLGGLAADFRLKPVLRTWVISSRVRYRCSWGPGAKPLLALRFSGVCRNVAGTRRVPSAQRRPAITQGRGSGVGVGNRPGKKTFYRQSPRKKDVTPEIVPKKRPYARNRCGKTTLGQIALGRTIPGPVVGAAFVPPMTTLVKPRCRPEGLAVKNLRRGPGAARILGGAPSAGAAGEKRKFVSQKFTADCRNGRARACKTISWAILLNPRKRSALGFN